MCKCDMCIKAMNGLYSVWNQEVTPNNYYAFIMQSIEKEYVSIAYGSKEYQ